MCYLVTNFYEWVNQFYVKSEKSMTDRPTWRWCPARNMIFPGQIKRLTHWMIGKRTPPPPPRCWMVTRSCVGLDSGKIGRSPPWIPTTAILASNRVSVVNQITFIWWVVRESSFSCSVCLAESRRPARWPASPTTTAATVTAAPFSWPLRGLFVLAQCMMAVASVTWIVRFIRVATSPWRRRCVLVSGHLLLLFFLPSL